MRTEALQYLACPNCGAKLTLSETSEEGEGHILEGELRCAKGCRHRIRRGVPILLHQGVDALGSETAHRFAEEWQRWNELRDYYEQQFLGWIAPVERSEFEGKVIFEGGCGKGRHTSVVAGFGAKAVVSVDLGDSAFVAFENTRRLPNVHVVQGDLMKPPVQRLFDLAFSVGVIHHLPDPAEGFRQLASVVREGGRVVVWVYGKENNEWITRFVDPIRSRVTARMPSKLLWALTVLPAAALTATIRLLYKPGGFAAHRHLPYADYFGAMHDFPLDEIHVIIFDQLVTPVAHYLTGDEVRSWFSNGFRDSAVRWHNHYSWTGTGVVSRSAEP